ncbi:MAG: carboxypeptidase regulatory-like domain-containing protein [Gemmatimonadaceae bacterium]|nr:carboxypeptidase regulatory-like domain-containing protein [Gemmatimonadaceae bacterium]
MSVLVLACLCTTATAPLVAQSGRDRAEQDRTIARFTGIKGVVVDSTGAPVAGAQLIMRENVRGTTVPRRWFTTSDSLGLFKIEGLVPGSLRLEVQREAYEPAGFDVQIADQITVEVRVRLVADEVWHLVRKATDSLARADSVAAAAVRGRSGAMAVSDSSAAKAGAAADAVQLRRGAPGVSALPGGARTDGPRRPGSPANLLTGRVISTGGEPVARAQITALGTNHLTMTDSAGRFFFRDLEAGPYFMRARKVGFEPVVFTATLASIDTLDAAVTFTPFVAGAGTNLDTMRVTADYDRMSRRLRGFEDRKARLYGVFIDREEIAMRKPQLLSDLLRGRNQIMVQRNGAGETQIFGPRLSIMAGYCPMALIVDGTLVNTIEGRLDNMVPIDMVAAVEVYPRGTAVPSEFQRAGTDCGAVIVWTR